MGHDYNSVALLYAYVPDELVFKLAKEYQEIVLWLDWDKNDRVLGRLKRYRTLGINVKVVMTKLDPKIYSSDFIINQIEGET